MRNTPLTLGVTVAVSLAVRLYPGHLDAAATFFLATRVVYTLIYCTGVEAWKGPMRSVGTVFTTRLK
jgi:hypothetical protein